LSEEAIEDSSHHGQGGPDGKGIEKAHRFLSDPPSPPFIKGGIKE
jgi:hypothetical protein